MKKVLAGAAMLAALPLAAEAQMLPAPGFYIGAEGGLNWMLNTKIGGSQTRTRTGWVAGGVAGYDFVGPRVEIEGRYSETPVGQLAFVRGQANNISNQLSFLANILYDFLPTSVITPYIGAGAGIGFVDTNGHNLSGSLGSTVFAYQGIIGVGWKASDNLRVN